MEALKNQFLQIGLDAFISMISWFFLGYSLGSNDNNIAMILIVTAAVTSSFLLFIMMRDLFRSIRIDEKEN